MAKNIISVKLLKPGMMFDGYKYIERDHSKSGYSIFMCECGEKKSLPNSNVLSLRTRRCHKCAIKKQRLLARSMKEKACSKCKKVLEISNYHRNKSRPDGRCHYCIYCEKEAQVKNDSKKRLLFLQRMKTVIKNEVHLSNTKENKMIWDGVGLWTNKYPEIPFCLECSMNLYKHHSRGVCKKCYNSLCWQNRKNKRNEERRRSRDLAKGYIYEKKRRELLNKYYKEAKDGKHNSNPKIVNIINNIENA